MSDYRDVLLREAYHRMKNDLNTLSALVLERKPEDILAHIHSLSVLYDLLGAGGRGFVDLAEYMDAVVALRAGSLGLRGRLEWKSSETLDFPHREAVGIGIAVSELITNASKHAYGGGPGEVRVRLTHRGGRVVLSVEDDGAGLPGWIPEPGDGAGLSLVRGVLGDMGGSLSMYSDGETGHVSVLRFPYPNRS